ncbi:MAG: oligosaccharyl transferase, archaeosortase A system-associated [Halolamina sp.]
MSDSSGSDDSSSRSIADLFADRYEIPALVTVVVVMFAIRMQSYSNFIRDGEVYFSGNDAWYHLREVRYTVRHWPSTAPFDPWTGFPNGNFVGQFGTLYDQLIATAALVVGFGSPSSTLVAKTLLVAPAVFGALTAIPTYLLGKRLGGKPAGLIGAAVLMLLPGTFLQRTLVGVADHNAAEPLFQAFGVVGVLVALAVAEREMPVYEVVREAVEQRDIAPIREPLKWGAVGGVLVSLYLYAWPPGIILVGIVGIFTVLKETSDVVNGQTPEPTAFAVSTAMSVVALLSAVQIDTFSFSTTKFSPLHVLGSLAVVAGAVGIAAMARYWEREELSLSLFPAAVLGVGVVGTGVVAVATPSVLDLVTNNLLRIVGFSANAQTRTIGEAQPFLAPDTLRRLRVGVTGRILMEYGVAFFAGLVATVWMHSKPLVEEGSQRELGYVAGGLVTVGLLFALPVLGLFETLLGVDQQVLGLLVVGAVIAGATLMTSYDAERLFVVVWAAFITAMAFTQVRFNYYLAVVVAVMTAYLFGEVFTYVAPDADVAEAISNVEGYQVMAIGAAVLLVLAPVLVVPINVGGQAGPSTNTASEVGNSSGPGGFLYWESSLEWLDGNTPEEGTYGGADNRMEKYGTYQRPADGDFRYPEGAYGVMSWWDYGHWITVEGDRIPNANPFQQGAREAANYLLAPSEERANELLEQQGSAGEETRYVMVDWQMATPGSKFGAPVTFYDDGDATASDFRSYVYYENQDGQVRQGFFLKDQRYYESMMVRLYEYHGSAVDAQPVVVNYREKTYTNRQTGESTTLPVVVASENETGLRSFDNMSAARDFAENNPTAQVGGFGPSPQRDVAALEHYRLVKASETSAFSVRSYARQKLLEARALGIPQFFAQRFLERTEPSYVKTFERVPGATVQGSGAPANTTVTATVQMNVPTTNSTFVYKQHAETNADGEFTMTLPYSTTGYDDLPAGYTNASVRANTSYTVTTPTEQLDNGTVRNYGATFDVSERKVVGVDDSPKQVELTPRYSEPEGANESNASDTSNDSEENQSALAGSPALGEVGSDNPADGSDDGEVTVDGDLAPVLATPKVAVRG